MKSLFLVSLAAITVSGTVILTGCSGLAAPSSTPPPTKTSYALTVTAPASGSGTITSSPAGISCPGTCTANFTQNTQVTMSATAGTNYFFGGWSGACSGTGTCTITMTKAETVGATFNAGQTLTVTVAAGGTGTVTSNPTGINCPGTCSKAFPPGTQVTLTETAGTNSFFGGWTGACSGTNSCTVTMNKAESVGATFAPGETLTVAIASGGTGTVTSTPTGIDCPGTCSATYVQGTQVTLTETAGTGYSFSGWSGSCTGPGATCNLTLSGADSVTATFTKPVGLQTLNHIIFIAQENRSFDEYFGYMRQYWANNGIADQQFDGLPQFTPPSQCTITNGVNSCAPPALPGCDPSNPNGPDQCTIDSNSPTVTSFHMPSVCTEEISPFWNEAHVDWNDAFGYPGTINWLGNGFVEAAANDARQYPISQNGGNPVNDINGYRTMGYFTDSDLNYYYFMASNFATSDRWFAPMMSRTQLNRAFIYASTSQGYAYPPGSNSNDNHAFTATTIFQALQNAGITWRDYVDDTNCSGDTGSQLNQCLANISYMNEFTYESQVQTDPSLYQNFVPISQFSTDVQNESTLPQVIMIEPASDAGLDEHPSDSDQYPVNIQAGAAHVASLINALMASPSWQDSALIFTYDEPGGFYDHVQPQTVPVPDQYAYPIDLQPNDTCAGATATSGPCSFAVTGYRIPVIVVSPYAKKNYVSHTVRDTTAWLSLVEERFGIKPLTARDGYWLTETDPTTGLPGTMDEFFDFANPPWLTPPSPPTQSRGGTCSTAAPNPGSNP